MLALDPGNVIRIPAGWGNIAQQHKHRKMIRMRTIQRPHSDSPAYAGSVMLSNQRLTPVAWNRRHLKKISNHWLKSMNPAQRFAWDAIAPAGRNGFDTFQIINKVAGPAIGDSVTPADLIPVITYPVAPAAFNVPPSPITVTADIRSPSAPGGPLAQLIFDYATDPVQWRAYWTLAPQEIFGQTFLPLLAIGTGVALKNIHPIFSNAANDVHENIPSGLANPQVLHVTADVDNGSGGDIVGPNAWTTGDPVNEPWLTFANPVNLTLTGPFTMTGPNNPAIHQVQFDILLDETVPPAFGFPNQVSVGFVDTFDFGRLLNIVITTPDGGPLLLPTHSSSSFVVDLGTFHRGPSTLPFIADFTDAFLRILGAPKQGYHTYAALRVIDQVLGTPSEVNYSYVVIA